MDVSGETELDSWIPAESVGQIGSANGLVGAVVVERGLVAVGFVETEGGFGGLVVQSDDGLAWERLAADDPVLTSAGTNVMYSIAAREGLYGAVGTGGDESG